MRGDLTKWTTPTSHDISSMGKRITAVLPPPRVVRALGHLHEVGYAGELLRTVGDGELLSLVILLLGLLASENSAPFINNCASGAHTHH